jgi:Trk K+ transport system NAD-binding subunit
MLRSFVRDLDMTNTAPSTSQGTNTTARPIARFERLRNQRRVSFRRWFAAHLHDIRILLHEARIPLVGFFVVMASGTLYWMYVYNDGDHFPLGAALYETMTMLALEQDTAFPRDLLGKILFFAIPIFGLGFIFQGVLDFGRLLLDKSSRQEAWQTALASTYKDHVIVCGLGSVAYRAVLELLESGHDVVVIESDWQSEFVSSALRLQVPVVHGDALNEEILVQAGLWRAHSLIAATSNDLLNIKMGLEARRLRPGLHVVLRVFNEQLDHSLEKNRFGYNTVFSSSALAAPTMAAAAVCRGVQYALSLPDVILGITELTVTPGGSLDSKVAIIEQNFGVQVLGYKSRFQSRGNNGNWAWCIQPDERISGGDQLLLLGSLQAIGTAWEHGVSCSQIMETLGVNIQKHITPRYNTVIVCGLGTVGYRVVKELHQMAPRPDIVVICDELATNALLEEIHGLGIRIIKGDARTRETLFVAGIERAYSVVAITSDKLTNVQICLTARHIRSDIDLVLRVFSDDLAEQLESVFGLQTTYSTSVLASSTLAAAAVVPGTGYAVDIGDKLMSTSTIKVQEGDGFAGQTIDDIRARRGIVVIMVERGDQRLLMPQHPDDRKRLFDEPLLSGDKILVMADIHTVGHLRQHHQSQSARQAHRRRQLAYTQHMDIPAALRRPRPTNEPPAPLNAAPQPEPSQILLDENGEPFIYTSHSTEARSAQHVLTEHWLELLQRTDSLEERAPESVPTASSHPEQHLHT